MYRHVLVHTWNYNNLFSTLYPARNIPLERGNNKVGITLAILKKEAQIKLKTPKIHRRFIQQPPHPVAFPPHQSRGGNELQLGDTLLLPTDLTAAVLSERFQSAWAAAVSSGGAPLVPALRALFAR